MFKATTEDIQVLRDSIDTISQIIDEGIIRLKPEGIQLTAADRAMVAVVDFKLSKDAFKSYECDKETSIGMNMNNFLAMLKRADGKVTLSLDESENKLVLTVEGDSLRNLSIPLIDISQEEIPPITQLNFSTIAELKGNVLEEGIVDADMVADSIVIEATDSFLKMKAEGNNSRTELKVDKNSGAVTKIDTKDAVRARYPLDYLKKFIKAIRLVDNVRIQLGNDYPMKLEAEGNKVYLALILAPRVSEE